VAEELPVRSADSKALRALHDAPRSVCPHCERESATVSRGICADCWGVKDPDNAIVFRREPQRDPLFDWDGMFDWLGEAPWILLAILAIAFFVARLALWVS
jgi:hypothetical protein